MGRLMAVVDGVCYFVPTPTQKRSRPAHDVSSQRIKNQWILKDFALVGLLFKAQLHVIQKELEGASSRTIVTLSYINNNRCSGKKKSAKFPNGRPTNVGGCCGSGVKAREKRGVRLL